MPKQRQTCTRCSQRRQKCDRKSPCTRCVQNNEGHLCTTQWTHGYNPSVHRKYPRKSSPSISWQSVPSSSTSSASPANVHNATQSEAVAQSLSASVVTPPTDEERPSPAWSSTGLPDITIGSLLEAKDRPSQQNIFSQGFQYVQSKGTSGASGAIAACAIISPAAQAAEIQHIQSLLPPKEKVLQIVDHYEKYMLYWAGSIYHAPTFRKQLYAAYGTSNTLNLRSLDWRWTALLFSIMSSCISGSSEASSVSWGFSIDDKIRLAREWGGATVSCLNLGNFATDYHIFSVHAIYIMHAYEHLVGSSNQWTVLRSVAIVIAKALGLHRLPHHPDDDRVRELNSEQKQAFIDREIGRRTWCTLASQDWLCSTSQKDYNVIIQKRHFTTIKPQNLDEETMLPLDDSHPSMALVGNYFYEYAQLLVGHYNNMVDNEDEDCPTKYARVLRFDGDMRAAFVEKIPRCLSPRMPLNPSWPRWVSWARKLHQASVNHKIIMIHQGFLSKSFKDVRFTYSRWACASASKNIINLYTSREPEEPQWWVEQAFIITAGICLVLDLFHRPDSDPEAQEYLACVQKAISFLQLFFCSSVATHGIKLLLSLLQEYNKLSKPTSNSNSSQISGTPANRQPFSMPTSILGITTTGAMQGTQTPTTVAAAAATAALPTDPDVPLTNEEASQFNFDIDAMGFEDLMDYLPSETSLEYNVFYDSMSGLANPLQPQPWY